MPNFPGTAVPSPMPTTNTDATERLGYLATWMNNVAAVLNSMQSQINSLAGATAPTAATVPFTPAGTIAATNVQAAIAELDADIKQLVPGTGVALSTAGSKTTINTF